MEISSQASWPASALSNFAAHFFIFDGEEARSMEGFLQSLKFENPEVARSVRQLVGLGTKRRGQKRNKAWKSAQTLWWKGTPISRESAEYAQLIDGAFRAMFSQSTSARGALLATRDAVLTHSLGAKKKSETVLTATEFCGLLMRVRRDLQVSP